MLVAVILFVWTFNIKSLLGMFPGPDFMPKIAAILLFLVSLGIFLEGLRTAKAYVPEEVTEEEAAYRRAGDMRVLMSAALIGFYVFSMRSLGFVVSNMIYCFLQMVILTPVGKKKNYLLFFIITLVTTLFFFFAFTRVLYLTLPVGLMKYLGF